MWSDLFRRHCSDETLLAHVDGELPVTRTGVNRHLRSCWRCRARLTELEEQARALATAFEEQTFPGPYRIAEAQHTFWDRVEHYERSLTPAPEFRLMPSGHRYHWWAAVACAMLVGAALLVRVGRDPVPKPMEKK
jgi:anti-sigma factor RsiW